MAKITIREAIEVLIAQKMLPYSIETEALYQVLAPIIEVVPTPWFISLFIVLSTWLSTSLFLGYISIFLSEHYLWRAIIGVGVIIFTTIIVRSRSSPTLVLRHFSLVFNLAGQVLFLSSISDLRWGQNYDDQLKILTATNLLLQMGLFVLYSDSILRFLTVLSAISSIIALAFLFYAQNALFILVFLIAIGIVGCWLDESRLQVNLAAKLYQPLGYALVVTLLLILLPSMLPLVIDVLIVTWWLTTAGLTLILMGLVYYLLRIHDQGTNFWLMLFAFTTISVTALLLYQAPGIIGAIIILLLGFHRQNRVLLGLSIFALIVFFIEYYYYLPITLLAKSLSLIGAGLVILGIRFGWQKLAPLTNRGLICNGL